MAEYNVIARARAHEEEAEEESPEKKRNAWGGVHELQTICKHT